MFGTLEDIKSHCDKMYTTNPPLMVDETVIVQPQKPPKRSYHLKLTILPPLDGLKQAQELCKVKELVENDGFTAELHSGKSTGGGYHIEFTVKDKRQQLYSPGQPVGFRLNPMGPPTKFRVINCNWDKQTKEFIYHIESEDRKSGAKTVPESSLTKI